MNCLTTTANRASRNQRRLYHDFQQRFQAIPVDKLEPQDRADRDMTLNQIGLALLELETIQNYKHNPTVYVELIGNALFNTYTLEYVPKPQRYKHIIARLGEAAGAACAGPEKSGRCAGNLEHRSARGERRQHRPGG